VHYLITIKAIYGFPVSVEAESAEDALAKAALGNANTAAPYYITLLPSTQWSIEPLQEASAITRMSSALQGMVQFLGEMSNVPYDDPRVLAVFDSINAAKEVVAQSAKIQEELNAGEPGSFDSNGDG
jgi:hypothetical protein